MELNTMYIQYIVLGLRNFSYRITNSEEYKNFCEKHFD